jgi:hypothetical protein
MKYLLFVGCLFLFVASGAQNDAKNESSPAKKKTKALFNGKDLKGWYTFLTTKGKNKDPEKIFLVEDNMLHISGKEFGYIATEKIYTNFHLTAEFKWGIKKYPPRDSDTTKRDNGICFYFR